MTANSETTAMCAPGTGVTVRMYNTGFGDCFLLAFPGRDDKPFYMMIDCGVHGQYSGGSERIKKVVQEIKKATGGHLDLITVTHEHSDHVSGFELAKDTFGEMEVERSWLAWTEDPDNEQARRLDRKKSLMLKGITAARKSLSADGQKAAVKKLDGMIGFYRAFRVSTRKSRDRVVEYTKIKPPRYLDPKKVPEELPGVNGVRVFVLGPPKDEEYLFRARPSKKQGEVYHEDSHGFRLRGEDALAAALSVAANPAHAGGELERSQPFAGNHRISIEQVKVNPTDFAAFFTDHYGFDLEAEDAWRRIDMDWQGAADSLALHLDSATNNTSLVLAIELERSKKVLLFTGDAQVGNWLSWHEGRWSDQNGLAEGEVITAEDLLRRTVLYKVGHHGSHNATLQAKGLEMMTDPGLTAMVPVDQSWAEARKPYPWKMPFTPMYEDLEVRTKGRILRTDIGIANEQAWNGIHKKPKVVNGEDGSVLYVELEIADEN